MSDAQTFVSIMFSKIVKDVSQQLEHNHSVTEFKILESVNLNRVCSCLLYTSMCIRDRAITFSLFLPVLGSEFFLNFLHKLFPK